MQGLACLELYQEAGHFNVIAPYLAGPATVLNILVHIEMTAADLPTYTSITALSFPAGRRIVPPGSAVASLRSREWPSPARRAPASNPSSAAAVAAALKSLYRKQ
jgi:hypothetical protein